MSELKIGKNAPAFSLENQLGELVSLKDFKDKSFVVVYFYPKAMTPGCTTQACGIRDSKKELAKNNIVVLGISPDEPKRLLKFQEKEKINFTLLSDPENVISKKYGCFGLKKFMGREFMGVIRTSFIIDMNGKIIHIMDKVNTKTHHEDIISIFKNI